MERRLTGLVFSFAFVVSVGAIWSNLEHTDCGSKGKVNQVSCNTTLAGKAAVLKKGTSVMLNISVTSEEVTDKLTSVVHGIIAGIPIPFPLGNPNACLKNGITCPIEVGKVYQYTPVIKVLKEYPTISLVVKWEVKDAKGDDLICINVPVEIVP